MPITFEKAARVYQSGSASHSEDLRLVLFVKNRLATSKRSITSTLGVPAVSTDLSAVRRAMRLAAMDGMHQGRERQATAGVFESA